MLAGTIPPGFDVDRGLIDPHLVAVTCRLCGYTMRFQRDWAAPETIRRECLEHLLRHRPGRWRGPGEGRRRHT